MLEKKLISFLIMLLSYACNAPSAAEQTVENNRPGPPSSTDSSTPGQQESPLGATISNIPKSFVMGQFDPAKDPNFVAISSPYADREGMFLHKTTYEAFLKMYEAAQKDKVNLRIISATRNFETQKMIWEGKWTGQRKLSDGTNAATEIKDDLERALRILEYSSMPGTSRHHWGTDIDLNALNNAHFEKEEGLKVYQWLVNNAASFGFCQPYSEKGPNRPDGYNEEKWHWSYLPLAKQYLQTAKDSLLDTNIRGFMGAEVAPQLKVVEKYVLGINPDCK
ncbi:MAG: M15 family metallopeptidase [Saprospiraceae bacterium]